MYMDLIHGDCLEELKKLGDKSVDFVYLDLPYGQTACKWDVKLDLKALWVELRRVAKSDRTGFFFSCTTKFGFELFNNSPKGWFRWDLVWKKNRAAGFLNAYRLPMRKHEMIYCFAKKSPSYDVSSHTEVLREKNSTDFPKKDVYGTKKNIIGKIHKEPLPTSDVTPPSEEHELVYCFAKKSPAYDVSSHKEFEEITQTRINPKCEIYGKADRTSTSKNYKEPLPTSDITPPSEEHELVYCFAKKSPAYDVSSHSEVIRNNVGVGNAEIYNIKSNIVGKTHKEPLPTSDITQPSEEHELVYCFAKKSPAYDVSSHSEYNTKYQSQTELVSVYGSSAERKIPLITVNTKKHKEPLPTSDITQPDEEHELVYCFAKKSPAYDVSSHTEFVDIKHNRNTPKNEIYGESKITEKDKVSRYYKVPLPTSDITPPDEDHELVYCFAKSCPAYDTSSHTEYKEQVNALERPMDTYQGIKNNKEVKSKIHKEPLPTSDITQPDEEHELVYCFAKKSPAYDVSSHSEFKQGDDSKTERTIETYQNQKLQNDGKRHKEPLPTSDITQPSEEHELVYCFAKKSPAYDVSSHKEYVVEGDRTGQTHNIDTYAKKGKKCVSSKTHKEPLPTSDITPVLKEHKSDSPYGAGIKDVYHNGIKGGNKGSILPTSDVTQEEAPSSWCEYSLDNKVGHRTAKPVKLMEFLLKYWTKEGDVVLDPTMGSGSMGVACANMNRNFIGIEKDDDIFDLAFERLLTKN